MAVHCAGNEVFIDVPSKGEKELDAPSNESKGAKNQHLGESAKALGKSDMIYLCILIYICMN